MTTPASRALLAAELDEAELLLDIAEAERELDVRERRLPPDARRSLFPHERTAATLFADIDTATITLADRLFGIGHEYRTRYATALGDELRKAGAGITDVDARRSAIVGAIRAIDDPAQVGPNARAELAAGAEETRAELVRELTAHRDAAARRLLAEAKAQGLRVGELPAVTVAERELVEAQAGRLARSAARGVDDGVVTWAMSSPVYSMTPDELLLGASTRAELAVDEGAKSRALEARTAASQVEGATRAAVAPAIAVPSAIYASELLDRNTCTPCSHVDGREYARIEDALVDYPAGQYRDCLGGDRCRGTLVYVWPTEAPPTSAGPGDRKPPKPPPPGKPVPPRPGTPPPAPPAVRPPEPPAGPAILAPVKMAGVELDHDAAELAGIPDGAVFRIEGPVRLHLGLSAPSRGGLAVKHDGVVFHVEDGIVDPEGRTPEELLDHLRVMTETAAPGPLREALGSVSAVAYADGTAIAASTGRSIVFYEQGLVRKAPYKRGTFDHEAGHSVAHLLNRRVSERLKAIPAGPPAGGWTPEALAAQGERLELLELVGFHANPPDAFGKARTRDLASRKRADKLLLDERETYLGLMRSGRAPMGPDLRPLPFPEYVLKSLPPERRQALSRASLFVDETVDAYPGDKALRANGRGSWGAKSGSGVTDYGASSAVEDWAETWRLYLRDRRLGRIGVSSIDGSDVTFAELFPNRAALIERWLKAAGYDPVPAGDPLHRPGGTR